MAEEYNVPWKIEGEYVITGNGKYHKSQIDKIVDQRDHEVNNLRMVNQMLSEGHATPSTDLSDKPKRGSWVRKYVSNF